MTDNMMLRVKDLQVHFTLPRPKLLAPKPKLYAVDGVSFEIEKNMKPARQYNKGAR